MGDRARVVFKEERHDRISPAIYLHWQGSSVMKLLSKTKNQMNGRSDCDYVSARFVQVCANNLESKNLSIGIINVDSLNQFELDNADDDNGVFTVSLPNWTVTKTTVTNTGVHKTAEKLKEEVLHVW